MDTSDPGLLLAMPFLTMGGAEAVVSQLCRQLKRAGFRIYIITTVPVMDCQGDTTDWFADSACSVHHLPASVPPQDWGNFITNLIAKNQLDLIWLVGSSFVYDLLPELKRTFPDLAVVDLLFNPVGHTANHLKYVDLIDHVAVEHSGMKDWLIEHGREGASVSVIPNGVDRSRFIRSPRRDWRTGQTREDGPPPFVIGFFGRLSEEKGPDIFIDLAARLKSRGEIEFLICGAGVMETSLRDRIDSKSLGDRVHMLGIRKTADYLPCCDVVVVCSRLDGRPNIVMESLAMGIPVVASAVGGIPEMAPEESGVVFVDPEDAGQLEAATLRLIDHPDIRRDLGNAGFRFAETHFSSENAAATYAQLFRGLIKPRRNAPDKDLFSRMGRAWKRFLGS